MRETSLFPSLPHEDGLGLDPPFPPSSLAVAQLNSLPLHGASLSSCVCVKEPGLHLPVFLAFF